jgi:glucose-1-phosphate cytidylyltransferase
LKVIILAGGLGTRISEETIDKPKPMVLLDDKPILWHLMSIFASQGFDEFLIATGYKSEIIEDWVSGLRETWSVKTLFTGQDTQTGGRIKSCMEYLSGERVIATYGDGLANVPIKKLLAFHESHGKLATVTAVHPPARFGYLHLDGNKVDHFGEKKQSDVGWINGGFFVLEPEVVNFVLNDSEPFETGALPRLVDENQLMAYHHTDFWQPMDTLRERNELAELAKETPPPWLKID